MTVLQALGFMFLGGLIVEVFECHAWARYQQGKREGLNFPTEFQQRR